MKKNKQKKGDHHFVPQVYIKRFYDENIKKVWRGNIKNKNIKYFSSAQIFYIPKLYDFTLFKQEFTDIENYYSKIENEIGVIYKELDKIKNINALKDDVITKSHLFKIIKIVILTQYFRTKDMHAGMFKDICIDLVNIYESKKEYLNENFKFIKVEELRMFEKKIKKGVRKNKNYANELIKALQHSVLPILLADFYKGGIKIVRHKTPKYISSDKPVACNNLNDILNFQNFIYPLTPSVLIYSLGADITEKLIKDEEKVNDYLFNNAISCIISHDKEKIEYYINKNS